MRDLPHIKKLVENIDSASKLRKALPVIAPILKPFGIDLSKVEESLSGIDNLKTQLDEMVEYLEKFNEYFAEDGWVMYDRMNAKSAKKAVGLVNDGRPKEALSFLVEYYRPELVKRELYAMNRIGAFRPRIALAQKALEDYSAGRYHACIPVILALMDGLVNDLHPEQKGIHSEGVQLNAWDSIAAHNKGLGILVRKLRKERKKTRTDEITFPFRNGILHGMDLGYDNQVVAAKTWALLFTIGDWAERAERGLLNEPAPEPEKGLKEILVSLKKTNEIKLALNDWGPRILDVGEDLPASGNPEEYDEETPERALVEFLSFWMKRNYGYMAQLISPMLQTSPKEVRQVYEDKNLEKFEILSITDQGASLTRINVKLFYEKEKEDEFIVCYVNDEGRSAVQGVEVGKWALTKWGIY